MKVRTVHIISHTHWDREWYLNSPYTNAWLPPFFEALFKMLEKEPAYRFVLDGQTAMIEDWCDQLERLGEDPAHYLQTLRGYVQQHRLFVGPYYLQPDWQLVSEEALVRNLLIGGQMAKQLGSRMQAGWLLDNFGQISQAPQVHREFGLDGLFVWRGVEMEPRSIQSEFTWEAPDGSRVTAIYLVGSYRNGMRLAQYPQVMEGRILGEVEKLAHFAATPNVLLMNGYDQELFPDDFLPLLESGLKNLDDIQVRQSTPEEYLQAIKQETGSHQPLKTLRGALYSGRFISVFPGILSSRMYLKTQNDACQKLLEKSAEPLSALLWGLGQEYSAGAITRAWKLLLKNHPHDSICGVSIDDVHTDMEARFAESRSITQGLVDAALTTLVDNINTSGRRGAGTLKRWVVVNTHLNPMAGLVEIQDNLPGNVFFQDSTGKPVASQKTAQGGFVLSIPPTPAAGYQVITACGEQEGEDTRFAKSAQIGLRVDPQHFIVENDWIKLVVNADGSLNITDKSSQVTYTNLAVFEDGADAGDTYNYSNPAHDQVITSQEQKAEIRFIECGPLRARIRIEQSMQIPKALTANRKERSHALCTLQFTSIITVEAGSALVRFHTVLNNNAKDHRLRVLFPTAIQTDVSHAETQFDVVPRAIVPESYDDSTIPENVKQVILGAREPKPVTIFPQRMFACLNDGKRGLAVLNCGLPEYEVLPQQNTIALTLLRSVGWIARPDLLTRIGDAGPLIAAPGAQCLRKMEFDFAILVYPGDWQSAQVVKLADEFNSHLWVVETDAHAGFLPPSNSFLRLVDPSGCLKVTALKCSEDEQALLVRFHNPTDMPLAGRLESFFTIRQASYVNLAEESQRSAVLEDGGIPVLVPPKKINTLRLEIERLALPVSTGSNTRLQEPHPERWEGYQEIIFQEPNEQESTENEEILNEGQRAAQLEQLLVEKENILANFSPGSTGEDAAWWLNFNRLRLEVASIRRTALEARLSETLLRKNSRKHRSSAVEKDENQLLQFEVALRDIGYAINQARVEKRALEYVVDYYARLVKSQN